MQNQLAQLQREIEALKERKAHAMANKQATQARVQELVEEMARLGVTPETIEAEIARLNSEISVSTSKLQSMIEDIKAGRYQNVILDTPQPAPVPPAPVQEPAVQSIPQPVQSGPQDTATTSFMDDLFADL